MPTKMSFLESGNAVIHENGDYEVAIDSILGHRFSLVDGKVVDKYNGVSDDEVKQIDYAEAVARAKEANEPIPPAP